MARKFLEDLLQKAMSRVNNGASTTLTARLTTESPPSDPRHLTDTRTRVSTLLEYAIAYEMNNILLSDGAGRSVSSVLWNVFPDLFVRDKNGQPIIGLEVKALHTAAEEKSANLATPLAIIRKNKDYLVILIWGWAKKEIKNSYSITYPHIHEVHVFDAWMLARIRDYGWMYNDGGRIKGIDLCSPVINGEGDKFKAEEGNMGKLMRIALPDDCPKDLAGYSELNTEYSRYLKFAQRTLALGLRETFLDVCMLDGANCKEAPDVELYPKKCEQLGSAERQNGTRILLVAGLGVEAWLSSSDEAKNVENGSCCLWLGQKLAWTVFRKKDGVWKNLGQGKKPDSDLAAILGAFNS